MYIKTSAFAHADYFDTLTNFEFDSHKHTKKALTINRQKSDSFLKFPDTVTITAHSGIALIIMTHNPYLVDTYQEFVLQGSIELHANICFNILSITDECSILLEPRFNHRPELVAAKQALKVRDFVEEIKIEKVYGFFYQVKTAPYRFVNDQHDYFEMTIVDQGELVHEVDGLKHVAKRHDCMLYYPNQRHSQMVKKDGVSTYLSIMFQASGISPELKNKIVHLSNHYTQVIEKMVELSNRPSAPFYADEMITLFKSVIIQMLKSDQAFYDEPSTSMRENYENELFQSIVDYLHHHVEAENQVNDLVNHFSLSRSTLQLLFKKYANMTPKNYINQLRLKRSKLLIKESKLTLSEIAETLGYGSLQYFSRVFTQEYGMSPSHYAKQLLK